MCLSLQGEDVLSTLSHQMLCPSTRSGQEKKKKFRVVYTEKRWDPSLNLGPSVVSTSL